MSVTAVLLAMNIASGGGGGAPHAPTYVQSAIASGGTGNTVVFGSTTTTGNTIVLFASDISSGSQTVTDNKGNTYTRLYTNGSAPALPAWGGPQIDAWYCENATGGATHTITTANFGGGSVFCALELAGTSGAPDFVNATNGPDASTPFTVATGTPLNNSLVASFCMADGNGAFGVTPSPMTVRQEEGDGSSYWTAAVATGHPTGTSPISVAWTMAGGGNGVIINMIFE